MMKEYYAKTSKHALDAKENVITIFRLGYGVASVATVFYGLCVVERDVIRLVLDNAIIAKAQVRQRCMWLQLVSVFHIRFPTAIIHQRRHKEQQHDR